MSNTPFLSDFKLFLHRSYSSNYSPHVHGRRRGGQGRGKPPWILKILAKKVVFPISRGEKQISPLLAPSWNKFWENPLLPFPGKKLPTPMHM